MTALSPNRRFEEFLYADRFEYGGIIVGAGGVGGAGVDQAAAGRWNRCFEVETGAAELGSASTGLRTGRRILMGQAVEP